MKKIGFIFALLFVIACNNNVSREKELEKLAKEPPVVNYERDSVYYLIDVKDDEQKEEFLVTRQIMVNDSVFGSAEDVNNWERAWEYSRAEMNQEPDYLYKIFINENGNYKKITTIYQNASSQCSPASPQYLKIVSVTNSTLDTKNINVAYVNGQWRVVSTETLKHTNKQHPQYCIDTTHCYDVTNERIRWNSFYEGDCY